MRLTAGLSSKGRCVDEPPYSGMMSSHRFASLTTVLDSIVRPLLTLSSLPFSSISLCASPTVVLISKVNLRQLAR